MFLCSELVAISVIVQTIYKKGWLETLFFPFDNFSQKVFITTNIVFRNSPESKQKFGFSPFLKTLFLKKQDWKTFSPKNWTVWLVFQSRNFSFQKLDSTHLYTYMKVVCIFTKYTISSTRLETGICKCLILNYSKPPQSAV